MNGFDLPLGVIALPAIAPLIALIQLLFPGLLGDHWKQYRAAIGVMMSQSTLMFAQWIATLISPDASWWLGPQALAWGMAAIAVVGFVASLLIRPVANDATPARIEFLALQGLLVASAAWLAWQWLVGAAIFDQMSVVAAGCVGGVLHLWLRQGWAKAQRRATFATESVFLLTVAASGVAVAQYAFAPVAMSGHLTASASEVTTYRYNQQRTGAVDQAASGLQHPQSLGQSFEASRYLFESSPVVAGDVLFLGARHDVTMGGMLFAVPLAADGQPTMQAAWSFGDSTTRAIFSSPAIHDGYVYVGEGYHQNQKCRLLCIDLQTGELAWSFRTKSHVESPPTIVGEQIYFGAGDDGVYCLNLPKQKEDKPTIAWHYGTIHVDSSPLVIDDTVYVGGVVGDVIANLKFVALDRAKGEKRWEKPAEMPFPAAASFSAGSVFVALGNGKFSGEAARPQGAVWRLAAKDGARQWEFPLASSVLSSPIPVDDRVYFVAHNSECYCLNADTGERIWQASAGEEVVAAPVVSGGQMYVVTLHGTIVCLDTKAGQELWRHDQWHSLNAGVYAAPTLANGRLYVAIGNQVHCLGDADQP